MPTFLAQTIGIDLNPTLIPGFAAVSASADVLANNGICFLYVKNANAASTIVTFAAASQCREGHLHSFQITIPTATECMIGPFPISRFGQNISVFYSVQASVTAGLFQLAS